jgi:hypothetical protein
MKHISAETLERYAMQTLPEFATSGLEEHLLICSACRDGLELEIEFVTAIRAAARSITKPWGTELRLTAHA